MLSEAEITARCGVVVARYNSMRDPTSFYEVRYKDGQYYCNCLAWRFHRICRHVKHAQENGFVLPSSDGNKDQWLQAVDALLKGAGGLLANNVQRQRMAVALQRMFAGQPGNGQQPAASAAQVRMIALD